MVSLDISIRLTLENRAFPIPRVHRAPERFGVFADGGLTIHPQSVTLMRMAPRKTEPRAIRPGRVLRVSAEEIACRWGISARRVRKFCQERRIFAARKIDGVWMIPVTAERPVDGRYYRCRNVPSHLEEVVHHADRAMRDACRRRPPYSPQNRINFFLLGSAFHLHKLEPSSLTFDDVRKVIAGKAVGGKSLEDQLAVLWHVKALRHVFEAVRRRRRLSVRLVEELRAILGCGSADGRVRYRQGLDDQCRDGAGRIAELTARLTGGVMHPIVQAGIFIIDFLLASPFDGENERTAYLVANFILMKNGYPPVIIYRALFNAAADYRWRRKQMIADDKKVSRLGLRMPARIFPSLRSGFFSAVVARAVRWSCKKDLHLILRHEYFYEDDDYDNG